MYLFPASLAVTAAIPFLAKYSLVHARALHVYDAQSSVSPSASPSAPPPEKTKEDGKKKADLGPDPFANTFLRWHLTLFYFILLAILQEILFRPGKQEDQQDGGRSIKAAGRASVPFVFLVILVYETLNLAPSLFRLLFSFQTSDFVVKRLPEFQCDGYDWVQVVRAPSSASHPAAVGWGAAVAAKWQDWWSRDRVRLLCSVAIVTLAVAMPASSRASTAFLNNEHLVFFLALFANLVYFLKTMIAWPDRATRTNFAVRAYAAAGMTVYYSGKVIVFGIFRPRQEPAADVVSKIPEIDLAAQRLLTLGVLSVWSVHLLYVTDLVMLTYRFDASQAEQSVPDLDESASILAESSSLRLRNGDDPDAKEKRKGKTAALEEKEERPTPILIRLATPPTSQETYDKPIFHTAMVTLFMTQIIGVLAEFHFAPLADWNNLIEAPEADMPPHIFLVRYLPVFWPLFAYLCVAVAVMIRALCRSPATFMKLWNYEEKWGVCRDALKRQTQVP